MTALTWGFQSPILLWALLAIIVPIAIHIFSKSKGRPVAFGSLTFIKKTKPIKMTQLRLVDRLLLVLRLLLVIVSVLFLAQLYLSFDHKNQETMLFVTEDWLNTSTAEEKKSLLANLTEKKSIVKNDTDNDTLIYLLNPSFNDSLNRDTQILTAQTILNWKKVPTPAHQLKHSKQINLWAMLDQVIRDNSQVKQFVIYTTDRLNQFSGDKLPLNADIQWHILPIPPKNNDLFNVEELAPLNIVVIDNLGEKGELNQRDELIKGKFNKALSIISQQFAPITINYVNYQQYSQTTPLAFFNDKLGGAPDWVIYLAQQSTPQNITQLTQEGISLLVFDDQWLALLAQNYFPQLLLNRLLEQQQQSYLTAHNRLTKRQITQPNYFKTAINQEGNSSIAQVSEFANNQQGQKAGKDYFNLFIVMIVLWMLERLFSEYSRSKVLLTTRVN